MSIHRFVVPFLFMIFMAAGVSAVSAQEWVKLGTQKADHKVDHDTIKVTSSKGEFSKIRLTVSDAPVRFFKVVVVFGNGRRQEIEVRDLIRAGGDTRVIDLDGRQRVINQVDFFYESASLGGKKAKVTLYGRR